jgi:enoyl-CoA hydratase/carnithine racemase
MIFTAGFVEAEDARVAGIVNEIVPPEEIEARTMALAEQIAGHAPLTIQVTKEAIRRILASRRAEAAGDDLVLKAYMSRDFQEGVRAFLDKRKPVWEGR